MMRAWEIGPRNIGSRGIGGLRLAERAAPDPGPGEVLVRVIAAGLNYRDCRFPLRFDPGFSSRSDPGCW
jgi:D-arabinose 1-dehydrogenase-like Zn-dependent alcohol dehydrogenase